MFHNSSIKFWHLLFAENGKADDVADDAQAARHQGRQPGHCPAPSLYIAHLLFSDSVASFL